jgi:superfamily II helicase
LYQNGTTRNLTYFQAKRDVLRNRSDVKEEQLEQFPEYYDIERTCKVCEKTKVTAIKRQFDDLKGHTRVICFECANTPTCHYHGYNIKGTVPSVSSTSPLNQFSFLLK